MQVYFTLAAGPNYNTTPDAWQSGNYISTSNQVNACDSTSNNFYLCSVQLEAGLIATPFEQRSIQQELDLCQRYYEKSYNLDEAPGSPASYGVMNFSMQQLTVGNYVEITFPFKTRKRSLPSVSIWNDANLAGQITLDNGAGLSVGVGANQVVYVIYYTNASGRYACRHKYAADAEL